MVEIQREVWIKVTFRPDEGVERSLSKTIKLVYGHPEPVAHQT